MYNIVGSIVRSIVIDKMVINIILLLPTWRQALVHDNSKQIFYLIDQTPPTIVNIKRGHHSYTST